MKRTDVIRVVAPMSFCVCFAGVASAQSTPENVEVVISDHDAAGAARQETTVYEVAVSGGERVQVRVTTSSDDLSPDPEVRAQELIERLGFVEEVEELIRELESRFGKADIRFRVVEDPATGEERPWVEVAPPVLDDDAWQAFDEFEEVLLESPTALRHSVGFDLV